MFSRRPSSAAFPAGWRQHLLCSITIISCSHFRDRLHLQQINSGIHPIVENLPASRPISDAAIDRQYVV